MERRARRGTNHAKPDLAAFWATAEREGMAWVLSEYVLLNRAIIGDTPAHVGYDPAEAPWYAPCICCEAIIRADRLDLVREHLLICPTFRPRHLRLATCTDRPRRHRRRPRARP